MSFFSLKDSRGITQLVVRRSKKGGDPSEQDSLAALSDVPVESIVLVEGVVKARPADARRAVRHFP
jgi:aspartyl-tRNA synthetase